MSVRITCINKPDRNSNHEAISRYGWIEDGTGKSDITERQAMVNWVKSGGIAYVKEQDNAVKCRVNKSLAGTEFLQTYADGKFTNNLLNLLECK